MTAPSAPRVTLSTSSVYPGTTANAFELAARLGYDGVEVMVGIDDVSADTNAVRGLRDYHGVPVTSVHAPCLLITQRVWGTDPWAKLERSAEMAHEMDADVVVVHPPFRWQRDYGRRFVEGIADLEQRTGIDFAVENMYPWRTGKRELQAYVPGWDPREQDYAHVTIDLSHTATSHSDPLAMAKDLGPRLRHVHVADGSGAGAKDEHLVPGRGSQPCADFLSQVVGAGFEGDLVVEVTTRKAGSDAQRETDLLESLAFVRLHADAGPA